MGELGICELISSKLDIRGKQIIYSNLGTYDGSHITGGMTCILPEVDATMANNNVSGYAYTSTS